MSRPEGPGRRPMINPRGGRRATLSVALCGIGVIAVAIAIRQRASHDVSPASSLGATAATPALLRPDAPLLFTQRVAQAGIVVEFSVQHVDPAKLQSTEVQEGDDVRIRFEVKDTATGRPARSLNPAAWMDFIPKDEIRGARTCEQKARAFLGGSIFGKAELNLNVFNVLTLNDEATVSVVDPLFGFGGTKLLDMVVLESPGEDWTINSGETRIFISLPDSRKVAVIDTSGWNVLGNIGVARRPGRVALQPDDSRLWVADEVDLAEPGGVSGITVIDVDKLENVVHIPTGRGHHEIVFSDDGRWAFVTNGQAGTVSIVDTRSLEKVADLPTGARSTSVAFSPLARRAYVTSAGEGTVTAVDGPGRKVVARLKAEPGLSQIRFAPGGRLGFVVNPTRNVVHILDAATNRIVQTADVEQEPDQVTFSESFAYVRHRGSETVLMVPLKEAGVEHRPVSVFSFPGGQAHPGKASLPSPADAIVQAPGENAVLVANPMDQAVYYYKEGMAAPVGNFSNYGRQPRAVLVVDRTLKERRAPGVYETVARIRRPGNYDVVFFLDAPRIIHCFSATVAANPALESRRLAGKLRIEHLTEKRRVSVEESTRLRFRLTDEQSRAPVTGLTDVEVLTNLVPGIWHKRHVAAAQDDGVYVLDFTPPRAGLYYVYLQCLSRGFGFNNDQYLVLEALKADEPHETNR